MTTPPIEHLSLEEHYAAYRPVGEFTFKETVAMIDEAIGYCRDNEIGGLLVDVRGVTGFPPPSTTERFDFAVKWSDTARGKIKLSMIARPEMIDPDKIGVTMTANRGLPCDAFTTEPEAVAWLLQACGKSAPTAL